MLKNTGERLLKEWYERKIADYFIAAIAEGHKFLISTRNQRDFENIETINPYGIE